MDKTKIKSFLKNLIIYILSLKSMIKGQEYSSKVQGFINTFKALDLILSTENKIQTKRN